MPSNIKPLLCSLALLFSANTMAASFSEVYQSYLAAQQNQDHQKALTLAQQAAQLGKDKYGESHINSINLHYNLATAYAANKQYQQAFDTMDFVTAGFAKHYGENSEELWSALLEQVGFYPRNGVMNMTQQRKTLRPKARKAVQMTEYLADQSEVKAPFYFYQLSKVIIKSPVAFHVRRDAIKATEQAYQGLLASVGKNDLRTLEMQFTFATIKTGQKKTNQAIELYEDLVTTISTQLDTSHPYELVARSRLVDLYESKGKSEQATQHCIQIGKMKPWQEELEPMPLYRVEPRYPLRLAKEGREGYAKMSFSIDEMGFVKDIELREAKGSKEFAKESIKALEKWRYAPKFENGQAVTAKDMKVQLDFRIDKS